MSQRIEEVNPMGAELECVHVRRLAKAALSLVLGFACLMDVASVRAATIAAGSCDLAAVQSAIDKAADGDTVTIPACPETLWSGTLSIDASARSLSLRGAGQSSTIIGAGGDPTIAITSYDGRTLSVSDIGFVGRHATLGWGGEVSIGGTGKAWRIHHLTFNTDGNAGRIVSVHGYTYGVIDHVTATGLAQEFVTVDGDDWPAWQRPQAWGDANAVFIEDNTIAWTNNYQGRPVLDSERGGRSVFRYNSVTNSQVGGHGFDSGAVASALSVEVYNNTFTFEDAMGTWSVVGQSRGGTGVWHDNTYRIGGAVWVNSFGPQLQVYRLSTAYGWGLCDGTARLMCSNIDINYDFLSGAFVAAGVTASDCATNTGDPNAVPKWKFCSNNKMNLCQADSDCPGGTCSVFVDGVGGDGYPCRMQPGFSSQMVSSPVYGWNNTYYEIPGSGTGGNVGNCTQASPCVSKITSNASVVLENRDFFNCGTAPCAGFNYVPYVYPHPLVSGSSAPNPPTSVGAVIN